MHRFFHIFPTGEGKPLEIDVYRKDEKLFTITKDNELRPLYAPVGQQTNIDIDFRYAEVKVFVSVVPSGNGRSGCRNVSKKCMNRLFEYRVYPKTEGPIPFCWKVLFVLFMLGTLLAMAAVCSSCQPEEEGMEAVGMEEGLPATIRVEVQGEEQVNFVTRTVNESVISDLHILVYNSAGELIGQKYQTGSSTITINTRSATGCTIYAVANTGKADLFKGYVIHKESYLKSMVYSLTNWDDLNKGINLPMTGSMKSVNIKVGGKHIVGNTGVNSYGRKS